MYVICGASGNIGHAIAMKLLSRGEDVRVIGRSLERLQPLVDKGAEPIVADLTDTRALAQAFTGASAVYAMIPPNYTTTDLRGYQNEIGQSIADAITTAGVTNVVNLSSIGAHLAEGVGVITGLHDQEERLNDLAGVNIIHLRPAFFMENHLGQVDTLRQHGMMATPQDPDLPVPQIATSDVADYAVHRLTNLDFTGHVTQELLGPTEATLNDVASAIGQAIGKTDLKYTRVSYDDTRHFMIEMGVSENVAQGMLELYQAFNDGTCRPTENRTPDNTTPTTINEFSSVFAHAFQRKE